MAIDLVTLSLSGMSSPVGDNAVAALTATALTSLAGVATDATCVEFDLLFCSLSNGLGLNSLKQVISATKQITSSPTGTFAVTFPATLCASPGLYQVRAKAIVSTGTPDVISTMLTVLSTEIKVTETIPQTLDDVKTAAAALTLSDAAQPIWKTVTVTGAQLKAATGVNTGTTKAVTIGTIPANAVMLNGILVVNTADNGSASTTTATLGTESTTFAATLGAASIRSTGETDESPSFVPHLASSTTLKTLLTVTGGSQTIANIADATSLSFTWAYVVPETVALGG